MKHFPVRCLVLCFLPVPIVLAGEFAIEKRPFTVEKSLAVTVLPSQGGIPVQIEPKTWADFQITEIASHGARVRKGETLVRFDAEGIDKKLVDARRAVEASRLKLAQAKQDLDHLELTTPHRLAALRRAAEIAKEEHAYFAKTRRKAREEEAAQSLERKKQMLANQQEELKQLQKMYDADDLTEETEEIILTRQKDDVAAAEFALRMETLDHRRMIEVRLPREAVTLADNERDSAIALAKGEADGTRTIALRKIEVAELQTAAEREQQALADLEHDRALFDLKARADGWFYHGAIENGRWTTGDAVKALVKHGRPAANRPFATLVPTTADFALVGFADDATARALQPETSGIVAFSGREDLDFPAKLVTLAGSPGPDGLYRADFTTAWPKGLQPVAGATGQVRAIAYHQPAAIAVPSRALTYGPGGWTVEVKLADGKSERRTIRRGRASGDETEILSGLEVGQVILAPEK